nr:signal recognition particle subunit SRP72-like [Ipomoea batatas]GMD27154.1 signal recognition particle subunit SRP72-like [Ipomoea batatas]
MAPKPKPKPSTAAAPAVSLEDLFTTLNRHIERSEYQQAVKVADQILVAAPGDEDAIHSCLNRMNVKSKIDSLEINIVAALVSVGRALKCREF